MSAAWPLLRRELRDSLRSYWFLVYSGVFVLGGALLMLLGGAGGSVLGYRGFARALAGLMHLALFVVPLMALFPGAAAVAGEREIGTLDYLLAQPVTRREVYLGKWLGIVAAVVLSLTVGFGATGGVAVMRGVRSELVLGLFAFTILLAAAFASLGVWLSASSTTRSRALSLGLTAWLGFLALGSLGVMGAFVRWGLPAWTLQAWSLVNPIEACRMAVLPLLDPDAGQLLGPVGAALLERFGRWGVTGLGAGSLLAWSVLALAAGARSFRLREA
ncbi:MAG: ABC transporter permease [Gemmatimonadota bacterium]